MTALKGVAFLAGLGLLAATAHVTISNTGGYAAPHAVWHSRAGYRCGVVGAAQIDSCVAASRSFRARPSAF